LNRTPRSIRTAHPRVNPLSAASHHAQRYLLDTNILSDLVRNPAGIVATRIREVGEDSICTSIVVSSELRYGARKIDTMRRPVPRMSTRNAHGVN